MTDILAVLLPKRAYTIAGSMASRGGKKLAMHLNGKKLPVMDFRSYLGLFDGVTYPTRYPRTYPERTLRSAS